MTDVVPLTSYTLTAGAGEAAPATAAARPRCGWPTPRAARADLRADAQVGGKLAHLGPRIVHGFARKMADSFFDNFRAAVEPPTASRPDADAAGGEQRPGWLRRIIDRTA